MIEKIHSKQQRFAESSCEKGCDDDDDNADEDGVDNSDVVEDEDSEDDEG